MARGDRNKAWVEIDPTSLLPIRIIKSRFDAYELDPSRLAFWPRSLAVGEIRRQVFERDCFECRRCAKRVTYKTGHMDEIKSKGAGGEVSVANCWVLCYDCHQGNKPTSEHGDRRLRFGESNVSDIPNNE